MKFELLPVPGMIRNDAAYIRVSEYQPTSPFVNWLLPDADWQRRKLYLYTFTLETETREGDHSVG